MIKLALVVLCVRLACQVNALGAKKTDPFYKTVIRDAFDATSRKFAVEPFTECAANQYPPPALNKLKKYVINLDLDPEHRWDELMADKKHAAQALLENFQKITKFILNGKLMNWIDKYVPYVAETLPPHYYGELKGVARASNMTLGQITLYNLFYEVFTVCTSIVAQDQNGKLYHARNMDFGLFMGWDIANDTWATTEALRPLAVDLDFQKGGKTVYTTVGFAGYIGALTGMRPDLFSVTLNERFALDGGFVGIFRWLLGDRSAQWAGFLMRDVLENARDYNNAVDILANATLLAPMYFIVGGNASSEGCVITRGRKDKELWKLGETSLGQTSTWYVVETNYDHWQKPPFFDDRLTPAVTCLDEVGQQSINKAALYNVLATRPVLNKLTVFTTLMEVNGGHVESWLQNCGNPCWPW